MGPPGSSRAAACGAAGRRAAAPCPCATGSARPPASRRRRSARPARSGRGWRRTPPVGSSKNITPELADGQVERLVAERPRSARPSRRTRRCRAAPRRSRVAGQLEQRCRDVEPDHLHRPAPTAPARAMVSEPPPQPMSQTRWPGWAATASQQVRRQGLGQPFPASATPPPTGRRSTAWIPSRWPQRQGIRPGRFGGVRVGLVILPSDRWRRGAPPVGVGRPAPASTRRGPTTTSAGAACPTGPGTPRCPCSPPRPPSPSASGWAPSSPRRTSAIRSRWPATPSRSMT